MPVRPHAQWGKAGDEVPANVPGLSTQHPGIQTGLVEERRDGEVEMAIARHQGRAIGGASRRHRPGVGAADQSTWNHRRA